MIPAAVRSSRLLRCLPHGLLAVWLLTVGIGTWSAASRSVIPPIWDQATYYEKARAVWEKVGQGKAFNPLDVEPVVRPPGTVLLSYPLGFDPDPRPFYFRSAFLPVLILVLACYVVATGASAVGRDGWTIPLLAALLAAMPMFWQFEVSVEPWTGLSWGMVDTFLGAVAALAAASFYRSAERRAVGWFALGIFAAALCPLIKPTGMLVSGLLGLAWLAFATVRAWGQRRDATEVRRWLIYGAMCAGLGLILVATWVACLRSEYFSPENIAYGRVALAQLRENLRENTDLLGLAHSLHVSVGAPVGLLAALGFVGWGFGALRKRSLGSDLAPLLALGICGVGVFLWGRGANFQQVRYVFPFVLPALIWLLPTAVAALRTLGPRGRVLAGVVAVFPPLNLLALLVMPTVPMGWQLASGVNLTAGSQTREVAGSRAILSAAPGGNSSLFALDSDLSTAPFEAAFAVNAAAANAGVSPVIIRPLSWAGPSVVRVEDLARSRFILLSQRQAVLSPPPSDASTFLGEVTRFRGWLAQDPPPRGTRVALKTPAVRVLENVAPADFLADLRAFVQAHAWRDRFLEANRPSWLATTAIPVGAADLPGGEPVQFGDGFRLLRVERHRRGGETEIVVFMRQTVAGPVHPDLGLFVHGLDADGKRRWMKMLPLAADVPRDAGQDVRVFRIPVPDAGRNGATTVALGLFSPATGALPCDAPTSRRRGHGLLIGLDAPPAAPSIAP